jgi:hypothetical protein
LFFLLNGAIIAILDRHRRNESVGDWPEALKG